MRTLDWLVWRARRVESVLMSRQWTKVCPPCPGEGQLGRLGNINIGYKHAPALLPIYPNGKRAPTNTTKPRPRTPIPALPPTLLSLAEQCRSTATTILRGPRKTTTPAIKNTTSVSAFGLNHNKARRACCTHDLLISSATSAYAIKR